MEDDSRIGRADLGASAEIAKPATAVQRVRCRVRWRSTREIAGRGRRGLAPAKNHPGVDAVCDR